MGFAIPVDQSVKSKENEKGDKYLDPACEKNAMEHGDGDTICSWFGFFV